METSIPILVLRFDGKKYIVDEMNPSFCALLKMDEGIIAGLSIDEITAEYDSLQWLSRYTKEELALIEIMGCWFEIEMIRGSDQIAFIHHNLTGQIEMDSSNKHLQTRLNQIQRIALIGDWEHNFETEHEFWSDEIYRILDFKDKSIKPNIDTFMRFVHPEDLQRVEQAHAAVSRGEGYEIEYRVVTISGKVRWIVTRAKVDMDEFGTVTRLYGTMQDITDRKKLEQKIEQAFDVAEDAYQSKSQFLAMISHEIRTPVNGIMGMGQLLKETLLNEEQSEFVEDILFSADALLKMIEDILEMSKMQTDMLRADIEEFDLHIMIRNLIRMYQIKNKNNAVDFVYRVDKDIPKHVYGDSSKIQQILINLLGNAFKFTYEGRVNLTVKKLEDHQDNIKIAFEVEDTGIGMSEEMQKKIFAPLSTGVPDAIRNYEGSGLGLAISKRYAELMQGYLLVESEQQTGSKFTFAITLDKAVQSEVESDTTRIRSRAMTYGSRVLVIEEGDVDKNYYKGYLEDMCGLNVDFAEDINTALHALEVHEYAFLVLSSHLKSNDSLYILKTIRNSLNIPVNRLPVIVVSTSSFVQNLAEFESSGASYFLEKPIDENQFLSIINEILDLNTHRGKVKKPFAYRYIVQSELEKSRQSAGQDAFDVNMREYVLNCPRKVAQIIAATAPLNILILSHEIDEIDDLITTFGSEDICESMELIKAALLNDDTAGIEVIIEDFMEEYQCFVKELQDFLSGVDPIIKKY
jgi:signal transduction histidine kinase/DNA-binding response OmpR family regulator